MRKRKKLLLVLGILVMILAIAYVPYHKWARKHTNWATAVEDHPVNCVSCHLYMINSGPIYNMLNKEYISPFNLAVTEDGKKLCTVAQEAGELIVTDLQSGRQSGKIKVGRMPHSVCVTANGLTAYVSDQWADKVSVIDIQNMTVKGELQTGSGPASVALSKDDRFLTVVNSYSNDVSIFDLSTNAEIRRLPSGNNPTGLQISPDGSKSYVTCRRAKLVNYGEPVETEITEINNVTRRIEKNLSINSAYLMENIAFTPSGDLAIFTMIRPKNLIPSIQVEKGWMMTNGIGIIEQKPGGKIIQLLIDEPNAYYSDPFDIVISKDGSKAFMSSSGADIITVISIDSLRRILTEPDDMLAKYANHLGISSRFVTARIRTGSNPKGLTLSPDGSSLYIAEQLEDKVMIVNTTTFEKTGEINLGGPRKETVARLGRKMLNSSAHTFQGQYSCYTCHPDTHEDGLVYNMASKDMGRNLANTQTLRSIGEIPPYKWNGKNQTIYKQDGMRFSTVLTRTEPFSHKQLDALVSYIMTGVKNPPNLLYNPDGELTANQLKGKKIFERTKDAYGNEIPVTNRCITCHPAPHYTNKKMVDVGTLALSDDSILFDTPHLNNIYSSAPYLHDGRAKTLEEIWTLYGKTEQHGAVNDLTKMELNYLIEYIRSFRDKEYQTELKKNSKASF
ncbi:MAG: hypothetical protein U0X39_11175 [Bacteroidales bacterium]